MKTDNLIDYEDKTVKSIIFHFENLMRFKNLNVGQP